VKAAIQNGRVQPDHLHFAGGVDPGAAISEMEQLHDLASLMRNHPDYQAPEAVTTAIRTVLKSGKYKLLE
jgi:hypothetical protein